MSLKSQRSAVQTTLAANPLEGEQLLFDVMLGQRPTSLLPPRAVQPVATPKPEHYKIVSISLYNDDIDRLDDMVRELKRRGHYKANRSQLIRYALSQVDLDKVPKEG